MSSTHSIGVGAMCRLKMRYETFTLQIRQQTVRRWSAFVLRFHVLKFEVDEDSREVGG